LTAGFAKLQGTFQDSARRSSLADELQRSYNQL
jgi:hypothetical protein